MLLMCGEFSAAAVIETGRVAAKATDFVVGLANLTQEGGRLEQMLSLLFLVLVRVLDSVFGLRRCCRLCSGRDRHDRVQYLGFVLGCGSQS